MRILCCGSGNESRVSTSASTVIVGSSAESFSSELDLLAEQKLVIAGDPHSPDFVKLNHRLTSLATETGHDPPAVIDITRRTGIRDSLLTLSGRKYFPLFWIKGCCAGGLGDAVRLEREGGLTEWLQSHDYDLIVIGGGSGGLATSKEAAKFGAKVLVLDFVAPSPAGTTWGLGGTCVNVGCIPKKLMHQAAILGKSLQDSKNFGWEVPERVGHNWDSMKSEIQTYISKLNWGYKSSLKDAKVTYKNCYGEFVSSHKIKGTNKKGKEEFFTADRIIVSTGLRPKYSDIPGAREYCITSDDLFSLPHSPGKTLFVGASYISLECAGFMNGIGLEATVMVRSILLRGFDQDMASKIGKNMEHHGIKFIYGATPVRIEQLEAGSPGSHRVTSRIHETGEEIHEEYNTVVLAIGREALTDKLKLDIPGVLTNPKSKKMEVVNEQSQEAPWVFGIGDIIEGGIELTPMAIKSGRLLANRLFNRKSTLCDYINVPTTVYTPMEYGCCGYSEEDAVEKFGANEIDVYHNIYQPLEYALSSRDLNQQYAKLIVKKSDDRVIGLHIVGPNAGEITQGFGLAIKMAATKHDFDQLVGIHPTCAEVFTTMDIVKKEGQELKLQGC